MLPFFVLIVGIVFLILWYTGVLRDLGERSGADKGRLEFPDPELERRLKVFERFLSRQDAESDEEDNAR